MGNEWSNDLDRSDSPETEETLSKIESEFDESFGNSTTGDAPDSAATLEEGSLGPELVPDLDLDPDWVQLRDEATLEDVIVHLAHLESFDEYNIGGDVIPPELTDLPLGGVEDSATPGDIIHFEQDQNVSFESVIRRFVGFRDHLVEQPPDSSFEASYNVQSLLVDQIDEYASILRRSEASLNQHNQIQVTNIYNSITVAQNLKALVDLYREIAEQDANIVREIMDEHDHLF